MELERKDIYDFVITLNEIEFAQVKTISDENDITISQAFMEAIGTGLCIEQQLALGKE